MPDLSGIPVRRHQPLDPYDHIHDNQPIDDLETQVGVVNDAVDEMRVIMDAAIGSQPDLATRLAQSLEENGTLKQSAVDAVNHTIDAHTDTEDFVRMTAEERAKLDAVAANATKLAIVVPFAEDDEPTTFSDGDVEFVESDTVQFHQESGKIAIDIKIPISSKHIHYYDVTPVTDDYLNYTTNGVPTAYKAGSLRVYVNGIRLSATAETTAPVGGVATLITYAEGGDTDGVVTGGDFNFSVAVDEDDVVRIDFDFLPS